MRKLPVTKPPPTPTLTPLSPQQALLPNTSILYHPQLPDAALALDGGSEPARAALADKLLREQEADRRAAKTVIGLDADLNIVSRRSRPEARRPLGGADVDADLAAGEEDDLYADDGAPAGAGARHLSLSGARRFLRAEAAAARLQMQRTASVPCEESQSAMEQLWSAPSRMTAKCETVPQRRRSSAAPTTVPVLQHGTPSQAKTQGVVSGQQT